MRNVEIDEYGQQLGSVGCAFPVLAFAQGAVVAVIAAVALATVVLTGIYALVALALRGSRPDERVALLLAVAEVVRCLPLCPHHGNRSHDRRPIRARRSAPR
jgi:hypothetical protein